MFSNHLKRRFFLFGALWMALTNHPLAACLWLACSISYDDALWDALAPHGKYLRDVLRHKRFVYQEGRKLGVSRLQLLVHDWQRFTPTEWGPYVRTFFGGTKSPRRKDGGYDPTAVSDEFTLAWMHHQRHGKHHWQHWLAIGDDHCRALPMPDRYRREMLADWRGAGRAQGNDNTPGWYAVNRDKMVLHDETRTWIEANL